MFVHHDQIPANFRPPNIPREEPDRHPELNELAAKLLSDYLLFTRFFYKERTGREFVLANPNSRESHHITMARALERVLNLQCMRLLINCPPGASKSEMLISLCAYAWARYPDSSFLYVSYSEDTAMLQTTKIRSIIELPIYRQLFQVELHPNHNQKSDFRTTQNGRIGAYGAKGSITGHDAGLQHVNRFSGALIIDDIHKPDEVHSDSQREFVLKNYGETLLPRVRSDKVPIIAIGHRLREGDFFDQRKDEKEWEIVTIPAIDSAGNDYNPAVISKQNLLLMKERQPYVFCSQYQQDPQPAGGSLFKEIDFLLLDEEPNFIGSFITADTAETLETYNDSTAFSHWGLYRIKIQSIDTEILGLHWIGCRELHCEPKDLENEFLDFWVSCMRHPTAKPTAAAIEKKSTGVSLISAVKNIQGIKIIEVERTSNSGPKAHRHISMQPYIASKRITFTRYSKHVSQCITHMSKITANNTQAHDDICDTVYDAIKLAFIDGTIQALLVSNVKSKQKSADILISSAISYNNKLKGIL